MKIFTVLLFFAASSNYCHGRTVATESGNKEQRDLKYFGYESNAPLQKADKRGEKQLKNGAEIPVRLVYDASHEPETEAVVKEVTVDGLQEKSKINNRIERSAGNEEMNADVLNKVLGIEARNGGEKYDYSEPEKATENRNVVRRIQHYETIMPMAYVRPTPQMTRIFDDYFPIVFNNPFNAMWSAVTNIVEYGPEADVCRNDVKSRKKREAKPNNEYQEFFIEDFSRSGEGSGPKIMKLKVRRGGVAIAGPGGIATAGSGGTAIVGPGGTAYTTHDGTAVVGPGGRVIEIPSFPITRVESRGEEPFKIPTSGKILAKGPVVYYNFKSQHPPTPVERL